MGIPTYAQTETYTAGASLGKDTSEVYYKKTRGGVTQGWMQNNIGWWYQYSDGSYPASAWRKIDGKWYYFDSNGYWVNDNTYEKYRYIDINNINLQLLNSPEVPNNFIKDKEGNVVTTRLNEELGKEIAKAGNGIYVTANNSNNASKTIVSEVRKMKGSDVEKRVYSEYDEQYRILAIIAFIILFLESFILNGKSKFTKRINFFTD